VIVLTGRSDDASIKRCEELGVLYVHKAEETWEELEPLIFKIFRDAAAETTQSDIDERPKTAAPRRNSLMARTGNSLSEKRSVTGNSSLQRCGKLSGNRFAELW
jgi:hypothetical protein